MSTVYRILLLALVVCMLTGCVDAAPPGPIVYLDVGEAFNLQPLLQAARWTPDDLRWIYLGARNWNQLGFDVRPIGEAVDPTLQLGDYVVIHVYRDDWLRQMTTLGGASDRPSHNTYINAGLTGWALHTTVAHELGHQLLETPAHLPPGAHGIMAAHPDSNSMTQADFDFACQMAGRCERF